MTEPNPAATPPAPTRRRAPDVAAGALDRSPPAGGLGGVAIRAASEEDESMTLHLTAAKDALLAGAALFGICWLWWSIWAAGQARLTERRRTQIARTMAVAATAFFSASRMLPDGP